MKITQLARILNSLSNEFQIDVTNVEIDFQNKRVKLLIDSKLAFEDEHLKPYIDHS